MKQYRQLLLVILGCLACMLVISGAQPTEYKFASVDMKKVMTECKQYKLAQKEVQHKANAYDDARTNWTTYPLLSVDDFNAMYLLMSVIQPTDEKKAELNKILTKGKDLNAELTKLQSSSSLTDAEKLRLQELTSQSRSQKRLQQDSDAVFEDAINLLSQKESEKITELAKKKIVEVAQKKGYTLVFSSSITASAQEDISQAVLDELNKLK